MDWWLHPCKHRPPARDGQGIQGGVKPQDEGGGLSQGNSVVQKGNRKSWDYYGGKGERSCVFLFSHTEKTKRRLSGEYAFTGKNLPPPAQETEPHINNTNKYHPISAFFSLCSPGQTVPETKGYRLSTQPLLTALSGLRHRSCLNLLLSFCRSASRILITTSSSDRCLSLMP